MRSPWAVAPLTLAAAIGLWACGGQKSEPGEAPSTPAAAPAPAAGGEALTPEQMEKGIGPVTHVELDDETDDEMVAEGQTIFETKCSACHRLEERYVGPELGMVLQRRKPEYVMNMILNSQEMVQRHPTAKALLAQYYTPMPNQGLTEPQARAVLEYLRENQIGS